MVLRAQQDDWLFWWDCPFRASKWRTPEVQTLPSREIVTQTKRMKQFFCNPNFLFAQMAIQVGIMDFETNVCSMDIVSSSPKLQHWDSQLQSHLVSLSARQIPPYRNLPLTEEVHFSMDKTAIFLSFTWKFVLLPLSCSFFFQI